LNVLLNPLEPKVKFIMKEERVHPAVKIIPAKATERNASPRVSS